MACRALQGNAAEDSNGEVHCQHGKVECWANTLLSCVMHHHPQQKHFFKCAIAASWAEYPLVTCAEFVPHLASGEATSLLSTLGLWH